MISWPDEIVSSIARRRAVLFLGAGVSRNSQNATGDRPPLWKEFLERGINRCNGSASEMKRLLREGDFLSCCQILKHKMGHDWVPFLEESFLTPQFTKAELHEELLRLDASIIVTPNFDKVFDNYATSETSNLLKIKKYYDEDIPRVLRGGENQRLIIKIHGCIDTPDKLIFTREDYASIRSKYANFYRAMDALILTHTFIFIGCGMNDPDLSLLLEQYSGSFGAAPPHYVTWSGSKNPDYLRILESNYNLRVLRYSSNDSHVELLESIRDLNDKVQKKKDTLAERQLW